MIEYLKTPPNRAMLKQLIARMGVPVREVMREKGTPYQELGLADPSLTDDEFLDAMLRHPILVNRPIVVTPLAHRRDHLLLRRDRRAGPEASRV